MESSEWLDGGGVVKVAIFLLRQVESEQIARSHLKVVKVLITRTTVLLLLLLLLLCCCLPPLLRRL